MSHPWHDVDPLTQKPENVNAVIEISRGNKAKYEIDKLSGLLRLDRVLFSSVHYPSNYGIIPRSFWHDGDPLDILVICSEDIAPLSIVETRIIGVMRMKDTGDPDEKILAVAAKDMSVSHVYDLAQLPRHWMDEVKNFFETYKRLEGKEVLVDEFFGKEKALEVVRESYALYKAEILPGLS